MHDFTVKIQRTLIYVDSNSSLNSLRKTCPIKSKVAFLLYEDLKDF